MNFLKTFGNVLIGVLLTVLVFFLVVTISSSVNGIAIGEQITEWFGSIGVETKEVTDTVATVLNTSNLI